MHLAVYLPLLVPIVAALTARPVAECLHPRLATWLLTASAVALAAASSAALGLLALTGLVQIPLVANLGDWSLAVLRRDDPATLSIAAISGVLLAAAATAEVRMLWRRSRALLASAVEAACLPGADELVVVDDPAAEAFAMPGLPGLRGPRGPRGRIVISTGMLAALDSNECDVVLAHERAHLIGRHYLFTAVARLAAAANPLLRPLASAVDYTVERWADEHAATVVGNRHRVARTVGKAALAATHTSARRRMPAAVMGVLGRTGSLHAAGPIPRRVAALLAPAPGKRTLPLVAAAALLIATGLCFAEAANDLHALLELASTG
jgi:Zn-dependent protease with chaperone function